MQSNKPVCEKLKEDIAYTFVTSASGKDFIPKSAVQRLLSEDVVKSILRCRCYICASHKASERRFLVDEIADWILRSSRQLFALLAYVGCPQLVDGFFEIDYNDGGIGFNLRQFSWNHITRSLWPSFHSKENGRSTYLAKQAADHKYKFFVPTLGVCKTNNIQKFESEVIIPITKEEELGGGISGTVFGIEILDGYHEFPANRTNPVVRKEVDLSRPTGQSEELDILLQANSLQDENIVHLITAYQHGNTINYIFPRAATNLFDYFRDRERIHHLGVMFIEKHPLWRQTLGIFRALHRLHKDAYELRSGQKIKVYHFDLKPANILVDTSYDTVKFLLADFGFSRTQIAASQILSSKVEGWGGTPAYAPPELLWQHHRRNHRYDVFSLGCILLEVCAFVVDGPEGVYNLDDHKETDETDGENEVSDDYFWHFAADGAPELKPTITRWMEELLRSPNITTRNSQTFLKAVFGLALDMMNIDVNRRIDAETAQARLNILLSRPTPEASIKSGPSQVTSVTSGPSSKLSHRSTPSAGISIISNKCSKTSLDLEHAVFTAEMPTEDAAGVIPIGIEELEGLGAVTCKYGATFHDDIRLWLYEDGLNALHLQLRAGPDVLHEIQLGLRSLVHVAIAPKEQPTPRLEVHLPGVRDPRYQVLNFYLSTAKDAATLQSVLLSENVRSFATIKQRSLTITSLKVEQYRSGMRRRSSGGTKPVDSADWGQPHRVQLWSEKSYYDVAAFTRFMPRRNSRSMSLQLPLRRLVIFCSKALILITFAKNVRLAKPSGKDSCLVHRMIPTDQRKIPKDPSFAVAVFQADKSGTCKVSCDPNEVKKLEESSTFECTMLEFKFESRKDWASFMTKYANMKEEWHKENAALDEELKFKAAERGWGVAF